MAIKYLKDGQWIDYTEQKKGIKKFVNGEWVDGFDNLSAPPIAVSKFQAGKWVQMYPQTRIQAVQTFTANNMAHINTSASTWTKKGYAICGVWESGAVYNGWLGLTSPSTVVAKSSITSIDNIECTYIRKGVGYWENPLHLPLTLSTLTSASGTGTTANNSKRGTTALSDTGMVVLSDNTQTPSGTTTFNNETAKNTLFTWLTSSNYSLLLAYRDAVKYNYVGVNALSLTITYSAKVASASFKVSDTPALAHMRGKKEYYQMFIYDDEIDMTFEEIIEHRRKNGIKDIDENEVIFD